MIDTAKELGVKVLAFGTLGHGLFADNILEKAAASHPGKGTPSAEQIKNVLPIIEAVKKIADEKGVTLSQLALAWSLAKYENVQSLVGTIDPEHLMCAVDALKVVLTDDEIANLEAVCSSDKFSGMGMRNFVFTNGRMSL